MVIIDKQQNLTNHIILISVTGGIYSRNPISLFFLLVSGGGWDTLMTTFFKDGGKDKWQHYPIWDLCGEFCRCERPAEGTNYCTESEGVIWSVGGSSISMRNIKHLATILQRKIHVIKDEWPEMNLSISFDNTVD